MLHSNIKININLAHCNMIHREKENIARESTRAAQNCMCQSVLAQNYKVKLCLPTAIPWLLLNSFFQNHRKLIT
jgi:hypothetical protein